MKHLKTFETFLLKEYRQESWNAYDISVEDMTFMLKFSTEADTPDIFLNAYILLEDTKDLKKMLQLRLYNESEFNNVKNGETTFVHIASADKEIGEEAEELDASEIHDMLFPKMEKKIKEKYTSKEFLKLIKANSDKDWHIVSDKEAERMLAELEGYELSSEVKKLLDSFDKKEVLSLVKTPNAGANKKLKELAKLLNVSIEEAAKKAVEHYS